MRRSCDASALPYRSLASREIYFAKPSLEGFDRSFEFIQLTPWPVEAADVLIPMVYFPFPMCQISRNPYSWQEKTRNAHNKPS